jgi:hypothetical protein
MAKQPERVSNNVPATQRRNWLAPFYNPRVTGLTLAAVVGIVSIPQAGRDLWIPNDQTDTFSVIGKCEAGTKLVVNADRSGNVVTSGVELVTAEWIDSPDASSPDITSIVQVGCVALKGKSKVKNVKSLTESEQVAESPTILRDAPVTGKGATYLLKITYDYTAADINRPAVPDLSVVTGQFPFNRLGNLYDPVGPIIRVDDTTDNDFRVTNVESINVG